NTHIYIQYIYVLCRKELILCDSRFPTFTTTNVFPPPGDISSFIQQITMTGLNNIMKTATMKNIGQRKFTSYIIFTLQKLFINIKDITNLFASLFNNFRICSTTPKFYINFLRDQFNYRSNKIRVFHRNVLIHQSGFMWIGRDENGGSFGFLIFMY